MRSDEVQNLRGAEFWRAAQYANCRAGTTVEPSMDPEGKQANIATGKEEMLKR